jgi:ribosome maturation factor RimP
VKKKIFPLEVASAGVGTPLQINVSMSKILGRKLEVEIRRTSISRNTLQLIKRVYSEMETKRT